MDDPHGFTNGFADPRPHSFADPRPHRFADRVADGSTDPRPHRFADHFAHADDRDFGRLHDLDMDTTRDTLWAFYHVDTLPSVCRVFLIRGMNSKETHGVYI